MTALSFKRSSNHWSLHRQRVTKGILVYICYASAQEFYQEKFCCRIVAKISSQHLMDGQISVFLREV